MYNNDFEGLFESTGRENNNSQGSYETGRYVNYYEVTETDSTPKRKLLKRLLAIAVALAVFLGSACLGSVIRKAQDSDNKAVLTESSRKVSAVDVSYKAAGTLMTASELYAANVNSTVGISTEITSVNFFGYRTSSAAAGSGFIITENGYIVTNYHVIEDSSSVSVTMYDGSEYDAEVVGYDESNDIAVLKIDASGLQAVTLGDSDMTAVGDDVAAIGNPLGELTFTLTRGVVSALDREVTMSNGVTMDLIQTDAAINSGNSGGALFNMYGEVIGITNAKYSSSSGGASVDNIGFAIPINSVKDIIVKIIETGYTSEAQSDYTEQFIYPYSGGARGFFG